MARGVVIGARRHCTPPRSWANLAVCVLVAGYAKNRTDAVHDIALTTSYVPYLSNE